MVNKEKIILHIFQYLKSREEEKVSVKKIKNSNCNVEYIE